MTKTTIRTLQMRHITIMKRLYMYVNMLDVEMFFQNIHTLNQLLINTRVYFTFDTNLN